jgi:tetratricopeptide (TPR) repeat protein
MNKKYIILLALIIGVGSLHAQSLRRFKSKATEAFIAKDYSRALEYYQMIINDAEDETAENYYNAAEAAREFRVYGEAEKYYRHVLSDTSASSTYQLTNFHMGTVLKSQGRYDEAKRYYQMFIDTNASFVGESFTTKAQKEINDCEWAMTLTESGGEITQLDSTINTPNSEFSPILLGNDLYFSSVRYKTDNEHNPTAPLTRIFVSKDSQLGQQVSEDFNEDLMHSAHATFNQDASRIYYTICSSTNALDVKCKIYYREKNDDKWGARVALSDSINQEEYTATQPNLGFDKSTGKEILFFVSDRPVDANDTEKDLNIWCSFREGDSFGAPAYIANVNTAEDDVTPFFDSKSQTLYFSSNGRQNMGGFDIYAISRYGDGWESINHMGVPINSSYDDLYYSLNSEGTKAYLSSNREGATCDDENGLCGCNDIFEVPRKIDIKVLTYCALDGEPLMGTTVSFDDLTSSSSQDLKTNDNSNEYKYTGEFGFNYSTKAVKDGFVPGSLDFTTHSSDDWDGSTKEIKLYLTPEANLNVAIYDQSNEGNPIKGANIELVWVRVPAKPEERELFEEETSLGSQKDASKVDYNFDLVEMKKKIDSLEMSDKTEKVGYLRIKVSKFGYSPVVSDHITFTKDDIQCKPISLNEKLKICKALPEPTKLYFFNDEPTLGSYKESYKERRKEPYSKRRTNPNTAWSYEDAYKSLTSTEIRADFDLYLSGAKHSTEVSKNGIFYKEVEEGMEMLDSITNLLLTDTAYLGNKEVRIIVRGFASPRAKSDYNTYLTCRRIMSIENYFREKGLLDAYPGQIVFLPDSNGEEESDPFVADEKLGPIESIYYTNASRERRVEIEWILTGPDACPKEEGKKREDYKDKCN